MRSRHDRKRFWIIPVALLIIAGFCVAFRAPLSNTVSSVYELLRTRWASSAESIPKPKEKPSKLSEQHPTVAPTTPAPPTKALPSPAFYAGVIEGFYGQPWSNQARKDLFTFMSAHQMNSYVYAPKDDPYQRIDWRERYPTERFAEMRALFQSAADNNIDFIYSISPGLSIVYSSESDRKALLQKVDQLTAAGIHTIMISLDDVPMQLNATDASVYGDNLALAQTSLIDWLVQQEKARQRNVQFIFTPTVYNGLDGGNYWLTLKQQLASNVDIVWTGPYVLSESISLAQVEQVKRELGHPLVIWDNYPVNDYTYVMEKRPRLLLGPLLGREPGILSELVGYLANPMIQPYASEIPLSTIGEWLAHPGSYDPVSAWNAAINQLGGTNSAALKFVSACTLSPPFFSPSAESVLTGDDVTVQLQNNVVAFDATWRTGGNLTQTPLNQQFAKMVRVSTALKSGLPSNGLSVDLQPWLTSLQLQGQAGLDAVALLTADKLQSGSGNALSLQGALAADLQRLTQPGNQVNGMTPSIAGDIAAQFAMKVKTAHVPPVSLNVVP